ncbi:YdeI/OmpD-associated family protein [Ferruginibacter sp. SUN106]|uniref:YdeI/OmpD-associated family protein n=1 Tax=Ferruginibacter sp. SUN106 TaxID=2978348 RepID=UPI003D360B3C
MVKFSTTILRFDKQGEKTGWTYIVIPAKIAQQLKPGNKKSFRVKGKLDDFEIEKVALMPMGEGDFIMAVNAAMRKGIRKQKGTTIKVQLTADTAPILPPSELIECMADEPEALQYFNALPQGHRNYFTKWIDSAKTDVTKAKRIALVIKTMIRKMDFGAMLREERDERKKLNGL